jgi:hypothetical protein
VARPPRTLLERVKDALRSVLRASLAVAPSALVTRLVDPTQRFDPAHPSPAIELPRDAPVRLLVAPTNSAGQGWAWARAAERLNGVVARTMQIDMNRFTRFPADQSIARGEYRWSRRWQRAQRRAVLDGVTHVLLESASPLFGDPHRRDVRQLRRAGVEVALLFHGSDIRSPARHRAREEWSPFGAGLWDQTAALERVTAENAALVADADLPVFVSTPDLLVDLPEARWLPVVVDPERWATQRAPFAGRARPLVVHIPSRTIVKGTDLIDPVLLRLAEEGLIDYRSITGLSNDEMVAAYGDADIVVDQLRLGIYGVAACEAMAAGRVVVSHVSEQVRGVVERECGAPLPVVEATPPTLEAIVRALVAHPERSAQAAEAGPDFVRAHHDGARSAAALRDFLGFA